jgi:hypothetical protein
MLFFPWINSISCTRDVYILRMRQWRRFARKKKVVAMISNSSGSGSKWTHPKEARAATWTISKSRSRSLGLVRWKCAAPDRRYRLRRLIIVYLYPWRGRNF